MYAHQRAPQWARSEPSNGRCCCCCCDTEFLVCCEIDEYNQGSCGCTLAIGSQGSDNHPTLYLLRAMNR
jgi:hypothetical protein